MNKIKSGTPIYDPDIDQRFGELVADPFVKGWFGLAWYHRDYIRVFLPKNDPYLLYLVKEARKLNGV